MVHNGIEYGLMAAYAEGLNIMRNPWDYRYALDLPEVAEVWRRGSVIGAWLLELTAAALLDDPEVKGYAGHVSDSGEGRWTLAADIVEGVPAPVISSALFGRFASRGAADYAHRVLSAMRKQFGGHDENTAGGG